MDDHHHLSVNDDRRSSPVAGTLNHHLTKETDMQMHEEDEKSPQTPSIHSPDHSDRDYDSEPPKQKRPKMDYPQEARRRSPPNASPTSVQTQQITDPLCDDFQNPSEESNSKDRRSCSSPATIEHTPPSSISPAKSDENNTQERHSSPSPALSQSGGAMPKLRLNALLASDPALMPDAKDLKAAHEQSQTQQRKQHQQQQQLQQEEETSASANIVEPVIKPLAPPPVDVAAPRMKVFMCLPCGIGFSSPSTLEAHQAYYCSHRLKETDEDLTVVSDKSATSPSQAVNPAAATNVSTVSSAEPAAKAPKTGKQYACAHCSYSADKKVSLNRHMRMHQTSPAPSSNASNNGSSIMEENSSQVS